MDPHLVAIRRYPVKSMGGESLESVEVDPRGLTGDRAYAVSDADGKFASGKNTRRFRRRDEVFGFSARTDNGEVWAGPRGAEWPVGHPGLDAALTEAIGQPMRVTPERDVPHFDAGAISLVGTASLAWMAREFGVDPDPRRLRVNLVVATGEPFVEETWVGQDLAVGSATLGALRRIERCRTVDLAQDGVRGTTRLLGALGHSREVCLGVYCSVLAPGLIALGDRVVLG